MDTPEEVALKRINALEKQIDKAVKEIQYLKIAVGKAEGEPIAEPPEVEEWEEDERLDRALEPMASPEAILPLLDEVRALYPDRDVRGNLNVRRFPEKYVADTLEQLKNFNEKQAQLGYITDIYAIQDLFKRNDG